MAPGDLATIYNITPVFNAGSAVQAKCFFSLKEMRTGRISATPLSLKPMVGILPFLFLPSSLLLFFFSFFFCDGCRMGQRRGRTPPHAASCAVRTRARRGCFPSPSPPSFFFPSPFFSFFLHTAPGEGRFKRIYQQDAAEGISVSSTMAITGAAGCSPRPLTCLVRFLPFFSLLFPLFGRRNTDSAIAYEGTKKLRSGGPMPARHGDRQISSFFLFPFFFSSSFLFSSGAPMELATQERGDGPS